ncbi:symmetrical bis(5'-nucleosyl)-tetraphosphatase [Porticoccaceae bacterium]|nr:symmetrical bis(5'-nucleosyl)-tetraphosphatase [Porticoccaceae bacterium]
MTDYVVGDLQGCLDPLHKLLDRVQFEPTTDRLIATGDLINRGPQSLETLRFCMGLGSAFKTVLGNHDLHLLAIAYGIRKPTPQDTLDDILSASDRDELINWLQQQPLLLSIDQYTIVHAGIPPKWTVSTARTLAAEVEQVLKSDQALSYFQGMYGDQPNSWSGELSGQGRWRLITNYLTRMRYCTASGQLELQAKTAPQQKNEDLPAKFSPWFSHPARQTLDDKIIFGHWAALEGKYLGENLFPLDTGYVWGGAMRLMNLSTGGYTEQRP